MKLNTLCGGRNTCTGQPSNGSISRSSVCSKNARCKPQASRRCATSCSSHLSVLFLCVPRSLPPSLPRPRASRPLDSSSPTLPP
jgi:hypothetical protein